MQTALALPLPQLRGVIRALSSASHVTQILTSSATERQLSSRAASTSGYSSARNWGLLAVPLLGVLAAGSAWTLSKDNFRKDEFYLLPLDVRQRIFFKYEKRIRDQSSLGKIFEYFSSQEKDGQEFLTPVDMLCAVVPTYPPSASTLDRLGNLDGERRNGTARSSWSKSQASFLQEFDVDGDGLISYPEFLLLLILLSIPGKDVKTIFDVVDLDGNGQIDRDEFKSVMELLGSMANVHTSPVGRSKKLSLSDSANSGLFMKFFGKDGGKKLLLPEFRDFLDKLHAELVTLEFKHYDYSGSGSIPAVDFGRSLVATADIRRVDQLLDKVDAMGPELTRQRISLEEFQTVHFDMRRNLHTLVVALDFYRQLGRPLLKDDFTKLLTKLMGVSLSSRVMEIIFAVFDDGQGGLDVQAFLETMQRREVMYARRRNIEPDGPTPAGFRREPASS
ncbi:hypothetical protein VOLCADRAFT_103668 [Volvox carteri f. nagariensis]|uniref:EF-hand domain-containing protein n=1 Tax=Volvox carteri f. nagariensis TaxID=3068 RepID=D8TNP3_VOLCA|nr:uncharacterized protein VOLCADRAFT_103668 [Volvox carteri f. nagariensis]EFJ50876.1 hypothetical protein VOLCADRAFT_103668 [Volvox carteri f. nagariensis]|eukprot:XP_002947888.1 hypothetical protein VOLCADRAFT_103668 [Volvox carteri f. nagariensis]